MSENIDLSLRQFERFEVVLDAELEICQEHRSQLTFTGRAMSPGPNKLRATISDIGAGGLSMQTQVYLPRMCEATVRLYEPAPTEEGSEGLADRAVVFEQRVRVRRCEMTTQVPHFLVGLSFEHQDAEAAEKFKVALEHISTSMQQQARQRLEDTNQEGLDVA